MSVSVIRCNLNFGSLISLIRCCVLVSSIQDALVFRFLFSIFFI
uniref:Uncharacterized protein n=1 Tax=Rhizophora mucronata TaxID=61149 RepID=A0A2P2MWI7_RHIMU